MFEQGGASLIAAHQKGEPVVEEGTGCVLCHRITSSRMPGGNSAFTVNLKDRESYVFEDALAAASSTGWPSGRSTPARHAQGLLPEGFLPGRGPSKSCH